MEVKNSDKTKYLYYVERRQKKKQGETEISGFSSRIRTQISVGKHKQQRSIFNMKLFIVTVLVKT